MMMNPMEDRSYQIELMEKAKKSNLIACLPTGSGKTYIAILLIKEWANQVRNNKAKRTVILVKRNELGRQQAAMLKGHVDLAVKNFCEGTNISTGDKKRWDKEINEHEILIFIGQKFLNLLEHGTIDLTRVNLLIMDECHHASGDDDYARILKGHYHRCPTPPRILGLTASISAQKIEPSKLPKVARDLEKLYQATIDTGTDQTLILKNSTSVKVKYPKCNLCNDKKFLSLVQTRLSRWIDNLESFLKKKKNPMQKTTTENSNQREIPFSCSTFDKLTNHFENLTYVACELGFPGFFFAIEAFRKHFSDSNHFFSRIIDEEGKTLCQTILDEITELINELRNSKPTNEKSLHSEKVLEVKKQLSQHSGDQRIIFVDRIYLAAFLTQVLKELLPNLKIKYIAGSPLDIDNLIRPTARYQREVMDEFRDHQLNVLISTAIIEEGIDVPACNLVIRFNKPANFSSYMQSKGRARAKEGALFVLLRDESTSDDYSKNSEEYRNYEEIEKMLQRNFREECDFEDPLDDDDDDDALLRPYRPNPKVRIDGVTAVQTIHQYCAMLSSGESLTPIFCFDSTDSKDFQCTLSMPINCPIREDVVCRAKNKRVAKRQCCLEMLEKLHRLGELDDSCLPIRRDVPDDEDEDDDQSAEIGPKVETNRKQTSYLLLDGFPSRAHWHVYRICHRNNNELAFFSPILLPKLPKFYLYDRDESFSVEISYVKSVVRENFDKELEEFSRYIFEKVFNNIVNDSMKFDVERSECPFLPCLLTQTNEIDWKRMSNICQRSTKKLVDPSELDENELFFLRHVNPPQLIAADLNPSLSKFASDRWEFKRKDPTIETYADHFESKVPSIRIRRDFRLLTEKIVKKSRTFYLTPATSKENRQIEIQPKRIAHYPIELVEFAPLNQQDQMLISIFPSVFTRVVQLFHLTQLEKVFVNDDNSMIFNRNQILPVDFTDGLVSALKTDVLPLSSFDYRLLFEKNRHFPSTLSFFFQSTTRRAANEQTDLENLEILGDCFLKLAMSLSLYHQFPRGQSGELTQKKDRKISNENLFNLANEKQLKRFLSGYRVIFTGKEANWLPPAYTSTNEIYLEQKSKRKAFSDMIEALIGTFLIVTDYGTTIKMMNLIGLPTVPKDEKGQLMKSPTILSNENVSNDQIESFYVDKNLQRVEQAFKYNFNNKALLISAMTHASYIDNRLTFCYERLEYLGDAVLDFLIIRHIFVSSYDRVTPSHVTDLRQDLANNGRLAHIIVQLQLHQLILYYSSDTQYQITKYINDESIFPKTQPDKAMDPWADSTAPKMLADVFEALVGAIFVDSNYSLSRVWQVIEPLLQQYIVKSLEQPNLNPVRFFNEKEGRVVEWKENDSVGTYFCRAQLLNGNEHIGKGKNKKLAKYDACRKALQELQSNQ